MAKVKAGSTQKPQGAGVKHYLMRKTSNDSERWQGTVRWLRLAGED